MIQSVEDTIVDNLVTVLSGISVGNNFNRNILKVYDEIVPFEQIKGDSIVLEYLTDHYKNSDSGGHTAGLFELMFTVHIHCFLQAQGKIRKAQNEMKADLEMVLFRNLYGNTLNGSCQQVMLANIERWGTIVEKPNCGITAELQIHYRQRITNPTMKG